MRPVESGPRPLREQLAPWAGLLLGALGWGLHHQIGSNTNYTDCEVGGAATVGITGLLCLILPLAGAWFSWAARPKARGAGDWDLSVRSLIAEVGAGAAALFALAILFQMLAGLMIPECWK